MGLSRIKRKRKMGGQKTRAKIKQALREAESLAAPNQAPPPGEPGPTAEPGAGTGKTVPSTGHTRKADAETGETLVLAASFTVEPILPGLGQWLELAEIRAQTRAAPYNQLFQELLDPGSAMARNRKGMNVILLRFEDWLRDFGANHHRPGSPPSLTQKTRAFLEKTLDDFLEALSSFSSRANSHGFLLLCPAAPAFEEKKPWRALFKKMEARLMDAVAKCSGIDAGVASDHHAKFGSVEVADPVRDGIGHIPFTDAYYRLLANLVARRYFALKGKPAKVIVLDCDNTLWGGVCGEVGPDRVDLDSPYSELHRFLIDQASQGMVLCLCSKNVPEDVWAVFKKRKDMTLKKSHVVDSRINWTPKSENLRSLAASLNLGADSFIFIDDNPIECAEVRANCPEALTLQWPEDPDAARRFLDHIWVFDRHAVTAEDKKRTKMYQANVRRERLLTASSDFDKFLKSLNLKIEIAPVSGATLPRTAQLTGRTNQFNFTTIRRSEQEIQQLLDAGTHECWTVDVSDRFGGYGLVGVMILKTAGGAMEVDSFMLSCRVLGRGVEYRMMAKIGEIARERGIAQVTVHYARTPKNLPAHQFLVQMAGKHLKQADALEIACPIPAEYLRKLRFKPASEASPEKDESGTRVSEGLERISADTRNRERLLTQIAERTLEIVAKGTGGEPAAKPVEDVKTSSPGIEAAPATPENLRGKVLAELVRIFAKALDIRESAIDPATPMERYVRDSFKNVEITVALTEAFPKTPTTVLFEHRTIDSIADSLIASQPGLQERYRLSRPLPSQPAQRPPSDSIKPGPRAPAPAPSAAGEDIAIVGISGRFPDAPNLEDFWQNLLDGKSAITEIPPGRWDVAHYFDPDNPNPEKSYNKWGGFINNIDRFDAGFFQIMPKEAELMDPQQRLFLEVTWSLLEDAGYTRESIDRNTGVFVGVIANDYGFFTNEASLKGASTYRASDYYQIPNRVSYFFDLKGPSMAVDTACSSSGTCIHLACESIRKGECGMAIAGGVNLFLHPSRFVQYAQLQFMSRDSRCRPFGDQASGTIFGEGIAALLLKPLSRAEADGDQIYGVIKATSVNSGGKTNGFTVPNPQAQAALVAAALERSAVDPRSIGYIEAHGTGTPLGDPIEIRGLTMAFQQNAKKAELAKQFCAIGSVKANIGHLESAAAMSGIIKILLQMKHRTLVPSLNAGKTNPDIDFGETPFYVQKKTAAWKKPRVVENGTERCFPRRAGISSFGAGGANAHILLEEYDKPRETYRDGGDPKIIVLSAKTEERLIAYVLTFANFLKKHLSLEGSENRKQPGDRISLDDIAYTLQMGREPMNQRLALIVENAEDLFDKLASITEGANKLRNVFKGNVRAQQKQSGLLLDGEEGAEFLRLIVQNRKIEKIAQLWVTGVNIDWNLLYPAAKPRRVSLPTYPFSGDRYWIPLPDRDRALKDCEDQAEGSRVFAKLHPLLDRNESTLEEQCYFKRLSGDDFFLRDHVLNNQMVMPAVAYLEMARAAGNLANRHSQVRKLQNIVWARRIVLEDPPQDVYISLFPKGDVVEYEVSTLQKDRTREMNAQGKILYANHAQCHPVDEIFDIEAILARCIDHLDHKRCYELYQAEGFDYGPGFKPIKELFHNDTEALARLELAPELKPCFREYLLHPTVMDGALQTVIGLTGSTVLASNTPFLPFGLGEIEIIRPLEERCFAYVHQAAAQQKPGNNIKKFSITILNEKGQALVKIKDYSMRAVPLYPQKVHLPNEPISCATMYYRTLWQPADLGFPASSSIPGFARKSDTLLVFDSDRAFFEALKDWMGTRMEGGASAGGQTVLVLPGDSFQELENDIYEINPAEPEDYRQLLEALQRQDRSLAGVAHLWGSGSFTSERAILAEQVKHGAGSLFLLCQALLKQRIKEAVRILFLYDGREMQPGFSAVGAMARTIRLENPRLQVRTVALEGGLDRTGDFDPEPLIACISTELRQDTSDEPEIRYENGKRWVRSLQEFDLEQVVQDAIASDGETGRDILSPELPIKTGGVYLITGGAGGLGLIFAEYLSRHYSARLILVGRSEQSPAIEAAIARFGNWGARVLYLRADVSRRGDVENLVETAKSEFGQIDGVIHAAGILRDSFVLKKSMADMDEVLAPKVYGTVLLDEITKDEPLDFFVLFSSLTSVIGNLGQVDYAYGNRFMDDFAAWREEERAAGRRSGKTIALNWPLWEEGGMRVDPKNKSQLTDALGIKALSKATGIKAFSCGLLRKETQVLVLVGDRGKVRQSLGLDRKPRERGAASMSLSMSGTRFTVSGEEVSRDRVLQTLRAMEPAKSPKKTATAPTVGLNDEELYRRTEQYLKQVLSQETKLPVQKIVAGEPLEEYGIDSVMILTLNSELEKLFGELSKTLLFEYQSISELAAYFLDNHRATLVQNFGAQDEPKPEPLPIEAGEETVMEPEPLRSSRHRFMEQLPSLPGARDSTVQEDIAIIGVSGRYPLAPDLNAFWQNLKSGRDCIQEIPSDRWDWRLYFDPDKDKKGKTYSKWGGFIEDADKFDPLFFNISPREAELMDPQERVFLETAFQTVADAGYTRTTLDKHQVGVFVGVMWGQYQMFGAEETLKGNVLATDSSYATIANRVSYWFNLRGPSVAVDTMCSSSLTAVHYACESIHRGDIEMALAGGVNLSLHPSKYLLLSQGKFTSSDGRCRSFGIGGDGYVPGEGSGAVLLKPLNKALADNDQIYAVIKGTSVNHGGKTNGYTVPNPNAQAELVAKALERARIEPSTLSYIEAHGTGTSLGDPIEITGLRKAFGRIANPDYVCPVGSVKSNIGHLEAAAGIAGLTKVLLQLKHRQIVPSLHSETLNPNINFKESPFQVPQTLAEWPQPTFVEGSEERTYPRRAGISSFGAGGANAHVILEEYPQRIGVNTPEDRRTQIVVLSARNAERLKDYARTLAGFLEASTEAGKEIMPDQEDYLAMIRRDLLAFTAEILKVHPQDIDMAEPFNELGFDPVGFTELAQRLQDHYGLTVSAETFSDGSSADSAAKTLFHQDKERFARAYEKRLAEPGRVMGFAQDLPNAPTLCDIAYTLQVGREAMQERLGIVVDSTGELIDRLKRFCEGETGVAGLYRGNIKADQHKSDLLIEGEEGADFLQRIIAKRKLAKLAQLWVYGVEIDWLMLHQPHRPRRVSLPVQPFRKKRVWIPTVEGLLAPAVPAAQTGKRLHPYIERNTSTFHEQRFSATLEERGTYHTGHRAGSTDVFPYLADLEMARAAGVLAAEKQVRRIEAVAWSGPIPVQRDGSPAELHLSLFPNGAGVEFEIGGNGDGDRRHPHAQGKLVLEDPKRSPTRTEKLDRAAIAQRCGTRYSGSDGYAVLASMGFVFGPAFRAVQELYSGSEEVLAVLQLPHELEEERESFGLHPSFLAGAAQTAFFLLSRQGGETAVAAPYTLDSLEFFEPLPSRCQVFARFAESVPGPGYRSRKINLTFADMEGAVCATLNGLRFRACQPEGELLPLPTLTPVETLYFRGSWEIEQLPREARTSSPPAGAYLVFDTAKPLAEILAKRLNGSDREGGGVVLVKPGKAFQEHSEHHFEIDPGDPECYRHLFARLRELNRFPDHILHLWSKPRSRPDALPAEELRLGVKSLFHLTKTLLAQDPNTGSPGLLYVFQTAENEEQPHFGAVAAMVKTVHKESSRIRCKTIEIMSDDDKSVQTPAHTLDLLIPELLYEGESEIRYHGTTRLAHRYGEFTPEQPGPSPVRLRDRGVVLVTGGAGGLGLIFARHLAESFHARLVLTGRSAETSEIEATLDELRQLGGDGCYLRCDVSDPDDVSRLVEEIHRRFGPVNGIVHAAGVLRDGYLIRKSEEDFDQVLAAKLHGSFYLDQATKEEPLDFFVMFSSMTAVNGNAGQADYAYANAFMDRFAEKREGLRSAGSRKGITRTINWPLWHEGGMRVDSQTEKLLRQTTGLRPLRTQTGLDAFHLLLAGKAPSFLVVEGDPQKLKRVIRGETGQAPVSAQVTASKSTDAEPGAAGGLSENVQRELRGMIAGLLKIEPAEIDLHADMSEFGFDSITLTEFSNHVNEKWNLEITPAVFFEHASLDSFTKYLLATYGKSLGTRLEDAPLAERAPQTQTAVPPPRTGTGGTVAFEPADRAPEVRPRRKSGTRAGLSDAESQILTREPVAIVGIAGVMPGCPDLDSFWENLESGRDLITEIPVDRWSWRELYGDPLEDPHKTNIKWGGFIEGADRFDAKFFGISNLEAAFMDPQQRVFLETVWKSIEDAGYKPSALSGTKTGMFVGVATTDYQDHLRGEGFEYEAHMTTGVSHAILANRVSYLLNLHGPSEPVDTACSSSLVALHRAVESIHDGECVAAIAGGVNLLLSPKMYIAGSKAGFFSPVGRCKTFDKDADGYVRAEGAGAVLLKPLSKAVADGDHIYAVIRGTAVNHGGHANSLTAPNPKAQAALLVDAYRKANIDPATVTYIETHGTGTSLGDPIEINGLKMAFNELYRQWNRPAPAAPHCGLGSVKSNVGHLEIAAGMAGLLKMVLALKHRKLPASLHVRELNPYIKLRDTPFEIVTQTREWPATLDEQGRPLPRRTGVSSFGFGGSNAHVVLEEYVPDHERAPAVETGSPKVIVLSAKNEDRLKAYALSLAQWIRHRQNRAGGSFNLTDSLAYTLQTGREAMEERLAVVAEDADTLIGQLTAFAEGAAEVENLFKARVRDSREKAGLLVEGREGREFIKTIMEERKLTKLARLWVLGVDLDWQALYPGPKPPARMPLPTYPFARDRYWAPQPGKAPRPAHSTVPLHGLHPLVERNTSTLNRVSFVTGLDAGAFFLADHVVGGHKMLPGVAYLEMARAAGRMAAEREVVRLRDVVWARPIALNGGDAPRECRISLMPGKSHVEYEVSTNGSGRHREFHAEGKIELAQVSSLQPDPEPVDLDAVRARCGTTMTREDCYGLFRRMGLDYGPRFQPIQTLSANGSEALADLCLPSELEPDFEAFALHPTLMDGAFQAVTGLTNSADRDNGQPYLPFALTELEILGPLPRRCHAYVRFSQNHGNGTAMRKFDIDLLDGRGKVLVRFVEFAMRRLQEPVAARYRPSAIDPLTGEPQPLVGTFQGSERPSAKPNAHPLVDDFLGEEEGRFIK